MARSWWRKEDGGGKEEECAGDGVSQMEGWGQDKGADMQSDGSRSAGCGVGRGEGLILVTRMAVLVSWMRSGMTD